MIESKTSNVKYSIIISYRDRKSHLEILLPRLQELFDNTDYEIIVAEQNDTDKFQKNSLYNLAVEYTTGDILIFHDVDYYPTENVSYYTTENIPLYPIRNVIFLNEENQPRSFNDIPYGYRNFSVDVGDHSGGVFVIHKKLFYKINGFNPYYKGWGKEDDDTRDRIRLLGYEWHRNDVGLFYALHHTDNKPKDDDIDFINNHYLLANLKNTLHLGYKQVSANVEKFMLNDIIWLKIKDFTYENS